MFSPSSHCISNTGESSCSVDTGTVGTVDKGRLCSLHPVNICSPVLEILAGENINRRSSIYRTG